MKKNVLTLVAVLLLGGAALAWVTAAEDSDPARQPTPDPALEEFIPTEQLPADSAVAFPVDI